MIASEPKLREFFSKALECPTPQDQAAYHRAHGHAPGQLHNTQARKQETG